MYLSHPVRRMRTDPHPDASVGLVVELDPEGVDTDILETLHTVVEDAGGCVERDLGFGAHLVVVPETAIDEICAIPSVVRVETDATITLDVEAVDASPDDADVDVDELKRHLEDGVDRRDTGADDERA